MYKKRALSTFIILIIVTSALLPSISFIVANAQEMVWVGETIYIRADGRIEPSNAPIVTHDYKTYILTKNVLVTGYYGIVIERDNAFLDGKGYMIRKQYRYEDLPYEGIGVYVEGTNITIRNLKVTNFDIGIGIKYSTKVIILNNIIENVSSGIYLYNSHNNIIENNKITGSKDGGIRLAFSDYNSLKRNTIENTENEGIILLYSDNNTIMNNVFKRSGLFVLYSYNNTVVENYVNGKPLVYLEGTSNAIISGKVGQVIVVRCKNITITGLDISDTLTSISLIETHNSSIINNKITNVETGIALLMSNNNVIANNFVSYAKYGIVLHESNNNVVMGNTITNNRVGIYLEGARHNTFLYNNFILNRLFRVYLGSNVGTNTWDDGIRGNYWSDHDCIDRDGNGVCENTYVIREPDNVDRFPLSNPIEVPAPIPMPTPRIRVNVWEHSFDAPSNTLTFKVVVINEGDREVRFQLGAGFSESVFDPAKGFPRPPYIGDISELGGYPPDYRDQMLEPSESREYVFWVDVAKLIEKGYLHKPIQFIAIVWEDFGGKIYAYRFYEFEVSSLDMRVMLIREALDLIDNVERNLVGSAELLDSRFSKLVANLIARLVSMIISSIPADHVAKELFKEMLSQGMGAGVEEVLEKSLPVEFDAEKFYANSVFPHILDAKEKVMKLHDRPWSTDFNNPFIKDFIAYLKFSKSESSKYFENIEKIISFYESFDVSRKGLDIIIMVGSIGAIILSGGAAAPIVAYVRLGKNVADIAYLWHQGNVLSHLANVYIASSFDGVLRARTVVDTLKYVAEGNELPHISVYAQTYEPFPISRYVIKNHGKVKLSLRILLISRLRISPLDLDQTLISPHHTATSSYEIVLEPGEEQPLPVFPQYDDETKKWIAKAHEYGYDVINNITYLIEYRVFSTLVTGLKETSSVVAYPRILRSYTQYPGTYTMPFDIPLLSNHQIFLLTEMKGGHKVYLTLYDSQGRITGLNPDTKMLELQIPGSYYVPFDEGVLAIIPLNISINKVVVNGLLMTERSTFYNLTITSLKNGGQVYRSKTLTDVIRQGEQHIISPGFDSSEESTVPHSETTSGISITLIAVLVFGVVIAGSLIYYSLRRRERD